jgi:hypothetical protein
MSDYYDKAGNPIDVLTLAGLRGDEAYSRIDRTTVGDVDISTVWLGMNHRYGNGAPLIFETMVFGGELDGEQERYATEAEAVAGHAAMVARVYALRATQIQA